MTTADRRLLLRIALLGTVYLLVGRLGLNMDPVGGFATLVWPPSGIALAALVLHGNKLWPGVALGAFFVNLWVGAPPAVAAGIALGNTLEAVLGAWSLSQVSGFRPSLTRLKDVIALVALPACLTTAVGATVGATSLELGGVIDSASFRDVWQAWWIGDMLGDLLVAPLLLTWGAPRAESATAGSGEALALGATLVGICLFVFGPWVPAQLDWLRRANFLIPILMWSAIRFGPRGATATAFVCTVAAVWGTVSGHGPFVRLGGLREAIIGLQLYLPLVTATFLALGAVTAERSELFRREQAARRDAERAVEARDDFLAVAAHELATPLTPLQLELETLHRTLAGIELPPNVHRRLDRASRQTKRLARLTERLLDVSRLASGNLYLEPTDFDFSAMVGEIVEEFQPEVTRSGIELTVTANSPIVGRWDRVRVAQVVSNLLSNAFRHGEGRPITLDLRASEAEVTLSVEDHGTGIDPAMLPRIFDRFERAPGDRRRGGLGLGLYVARKIVEAHGGSIRVASTPGAGSTFTISLLRSPPPQAEEAAPAPGAARRGIDSGSP